MRNVLGLVRAVQSTHTSFGNSPPISRTTRMATTSIQRRTTKADGFRFTSAKVIWRTGSATITIKRAASRRKAQPTSASTKKRKTGPRKRQTFWRTIRMPTRRVAAMRKRAAKAAAPGSRRDRLTKGENVMKVNNVNGTSDSSCKCGSWLDHWKKFGGGSVPTYCPVEQCLEKDLVA